MEQPSNNDSDTLVVTLLIQMHGKVITFDLDTATSTIFDNVRLLCKSNGFNDYSSNLMQEIFSVDKLKKVFTKNLRDTTYKILNEFNSGILVDNITYDKSLSAQGSFFDFETPFQGIYLLSIHQNNLLIYPTNYPSGHNKILNLLYLDDLRTLCNFFEKSVPNIEDISVPFPQQEIYITEEKQVQNNPNLSEDEKQTMIRNIRNQFYNYMKRWQLTLSDNEEKIEVIKLSTMVAIVKQIIGPCFINLLDYSCNSTSKYIPEEQEILKNSALKTGDIENTPNYPNRTRLGGKRRTNKRNKRNKRTRNKRNKTKKYRK